jgi:hypothetical protein
VPPSLLLGESESKCKLERRAQRELWHYRPGPATGARGRGHSGPASPGGGASVVAQAARAAVARRRRAAAGPRAARGY